MARRCSGLAILHEQANTAAYRRTRITDRQQYVCFLHARHVLCPKLARYMPLLSAPPVRKPLPWTGTWGVAHQVSSLSMRRDCRTQNCRRPCSRPARPTRRARRAYYLCFRSLQGRAHLGWGLWAPGLAVASCVWYGHRPSPGGSESSFSSGPLGPVCRRLCGGRGCAPGTAKPPARSGFVQ